MEAVKKHYQVFPQIKAIQTCQRTLSDTISSVNFQNEKHKRSFPKLEETNSTLTETVGERKYKILAEGNQTEIESVKIETSTIKENLDETIRINDERSELLLQQSSKN